MKGIKTAVKTDWKNYVHMANSRCLRPDKEWNLGYLDLSKGDTYFVSFHIKWKVQDIGTRTPFIGQFGVWNFFGAPGKAEGEMDYVSLKLTMSKEPAENTLLIYSSIINYDSTVVIGNDGYIEITNFMCSKGDKPMPYIDCDELKAEGGAIVRFLSAAVLNLAYAGRKEAA